MDGLLFHSRKEPDGSRRNNQPTSSPVSLPPSARELGGDSAASRYRESGPQLSLLRADAALPLRQGGNHQRSRWGAARQRLLRPRHRPLHCRKPIPAPRPLPGRTWERSWERRRLASPLRHRPRPVRHHDPREPAQGRRPEHSAPGAPQVRPVGAVSRSVARRPRRSASPSASAPSTAPSAPTSSRMPPRRRWRDAASTCSFYAASPLTRAPARRPSSSAATGSRRATSLPLPTTCGSTASSPSSSSA
jgi:hypothetical protein